MCKKEVGYFAHWNNYGVFTSYKAARQAIDRSFVYNKGTDFKTDQYNPDHFDYKLLSTEGQECLYRAIIETHILNKMW